MAREQFTFCHTLRVRWAEGDKQGIIFNADPASKKSVLLPEVQRQKMIACERATPDLAGASA